MHSPMAVSPLSASACEQEHEHDSSNVVHSAEPSSTSCRELARQGSSVSSRKSGGEQEQALSPAPSEPSDGITRIASTFQAATQDMLINLVKEPGAAEREVSDLFIFPVYPMSGTPAAQQENLQLSQRQHEIMAALSGCSDVMTMLRRVKPKAYLAIHELYGIDRLSFSVWFKLLRASQRRPNGFRAAAAAQSAEAAATSKAAVSAPASHKGTTAQTQTQPQAGPLDWNPALGRHHSMGDSAQAGLARSADGRAMSNQWSLDQSLVSSVTSWELASGQSPTLGRVPSSRVSETSPFAPTPAFASSHSYPSFSGYPQTRLLPEQGLERPDQGWEAAAPTEYGNGRLYRCGRPQAPLRGVQETQPPHEVQQHQHPLGTMATCSGSMNPSCPCSPAVSALRAQHMHVHAVPSMPAHHASHDPHAWQHGDPVSPPSPDHALWNMQHARPNGAQSPTLPTTSSEPLPQASPASRQQRLQTQPTTPARKRALEAPQEQAIEPGLAPAARRTPAAAMVPQSAFVMAAAGQPYQQSWQRQVQMQQMQQMQIQRQQIQRQQDQQLAAMMSKPRPSYWQGPGAMLWQQEWQPSCPQPHRIVAGGHGSDLAGAGLYREGHGTPQPGMAAHRSVSERRGMSYRGGGAVHSEPAPPQHQDHLPASFHRYRTSASPPCSPPVFAPDSYGGYVAAGTRPEPELLEARVPPSPSDPQTLQPQQGSEAPDLEFLNWFLEHADAA